MQSNNRNLQYLLDRRAIEDCLNRYARAVDRHDVEMIHSVFHPDAIDNHGNFVGGPVPFATWVNDLHEFKTRIHMHNITCKSCEIDGDTAWTESYVAFVLHLRTSDRVMFGSGRYIDRLEKRNGVWKIALRRTMTDSRLEADAVETAAKEGFSRGTWDKSDISYDRPAANAEASK